MPTSSQSLILQTTSGELPPFFGRRHWRPEVPPGPEWNASEYPISTVHVKHNYTENGRKRQKFNKKTQPLQRAGSAPELSYKLDFSSLPQILRIRGLHGSLRYDTDSKSVAWKINTIGPFYDRMNNRHPGLVRKITPATLRLFHADRENRSVYDRGTDMAAEFAYQPDFRRQVRFHETQGYRNDPQTLVESNAYISLKETDGEVHMIKASLETADYFKLIQLNNQLDDENREMSTPLFRLEKCRPSDVGCFRLAPTEAKDIGDFKLVPPPGYIADDFRLVPSSEMHGAFVLLQSDPGNPSQYRPVQRNKETAEEFRLVRAKIRESSLDQQKMDIIMPREAWGNGDYSLEYDTYNSGTVQRYEHGTVQRLKDKGSSNMNLRASENRYNYFDDVSSNYGPIEKEYTLPDISLYDSHWQGVLHHQRQTSHHADIDSTFDNDLKLFNQHLEEFNQRYMENMQVSSADDYNRFVHLGFRKMKNEEDDRKKTTTNTGSSTIQHSSDWRTHNFDQWSRTTKVSQDDPATSTSFGFSGNVRKMPSLKTEEESSDEEQDSLVDEVKFKANYKQWKKKKVTTLRMRKELPPEDPTAVLVRFGNNSLSHNELKSKIENETGLNIESLQFDPVSVQAIDAEATSRWIIRFEDASVCENLVATGIRLNGVKFQVRKFDDVMKEEHDAYRFYQTMKKISERKSKRSVSVQKDIQKPRTLKTTQTQTIKQEIK